MNGTTSNGDKKRVAILGAGPCGIAQLQAFVTAAKSGESIPELVCYEKQGDWGGLWNYSWQTGIDGRGEPVHNGQYRHLWSNGPKECLEFADYSFEEHFGKQIPSFPPREVLRDYILGRANKNDLKRYVRFNTAVRHVSDDDKSGKLVVTSESLGDPSEHSSVKSELFDHVVVCTGHFSFPHVPHFDGMDSFPGRVLHAHDFRCAEEFRSRDVLVVGGSYSAEDIALQCHKFGASTVTISYRTAAMGFKWPESMDERPLIEKVDGKTVSFIDGTKKAFDAIILCTGYRHHFPFMEDKLRLRSTNVLYPKGLYKGVIWNGDPRVSYLGMPDQWYTFTHFDLMAWLARDVILGTTELPSKEDRAADIAKWMSIEGELTDAYGMIDFQANHLLDIANITDYPKFDVGLTVTEFKQWKGHKSRDILTYRDECFASPVTGKVAPPPTKTWLEAMDDSLKTFLSDA